MEYNSYLQNCGNDDVVLFDTELCKFGKFKEVLEPAIKPIGDIIVNYLASQGIKGTQIYHRNGNERWEVNSKWLSEGKDCEILRISSNGWQKGKMRIKVTLEFQPDEPEIPETQNNHKTEIVPPESPLDDLRQMMN